MIEYSPIGIPEPGPKPIEASRKNRLKAADKFNSAVRAGDTDSARKYLMAAMPPPEIPRPIRGSVPTQRMTLAVSETDTFGKAKHGLPVRLKLFDGRWNEDRSPMHTDAFYDASPDEASGLAAKFARRDSFAQSNAEVGLEQIRGVTVPMCIQDDTTAKGGAGRSVTPVYLFPETMSDGQAGREAAGSAKRQGDRYDRPGLVKLRVTGTVAPFMSGDIVRSDMAAVQRLDTVVRNPNMSVNEWLGSNGLQVGGGKHSELSGGELAENREKVLGYFRDVRTRLGQEQDNLRQLGVVPVTSYSDGRECTALYFDLDNGRLPEALQALGRICDGSGVDGRNNFHVAPLALDHSMAFEGRDPDRPLRRRMFAPISFGTYAGIQATPTEVEYASLAAESPSWALTAYSSSVCRTAREAGHGGISGQAVEDMKAAVKLDAPEALAKAFGLEDVKQAAFEAASSHMPRDPAARRMFLQPPTERMIAANGRALHDQLMDVRDALAKGSIDVAPGTSWTEIKPDGSGPDLKR